MPRGRKKKIVETKTRKIENCCYWSNCTKFCAEERKHLCCAFCPVPNCSIRCKDYKNGCENLTNNEYLKIDPYTKYQTLIKFKEKEEPKPELTAVKKGRGRPKKEVK